ncbi:MAG TPA: alkaline phosphatase D family protein [Gaiellaceae bacterium]|nr:alkaline phosphatase D family protein [Gaiellaceae bacterium]
MELLLGPLLRYAGTKSATFWVETSEACEVEVLGERERTFAVEGHHYALILVEDLEPGSVIEYDVRLDGRVVWPPDEGRPAPAVHTRSGERRVRLVFGSCRIGDPQPTADEFPESGIDALWTYSRQLQRGEVEWPDALLLLGDQVYADEVSPATAEFIRERRDVGEPPGEEVADFEEYTRLYRESWSDPDIRWLLSTVPTAMIFDDHDVNDDWNISAGWVGEMREEPWWDARITGAFMSYWLYQHLGNLSPPQLAEEELLPLVRADDDAGPRLREAARRWDREYAHSRWAYYRDFGDSRLIVIDSRAARVLDEQRREMIDEEEWGWIVEHARGEFDHLVLASTLPVFMPKGIHHLEAWNEAVCAGAWGRLAARLGEKLRRAFDLEHWSAFHDSFERLCEWLEHVAGGAEREQPPATIVLLGGDVHNAYVNEVTLETRAAAPSRVFQVVCSPFRNPLGGLQRRAVRLIGSNAAGAVLGRLARLAGVRPSRADWHLVRRPSFHNSIGELDLDGRSARVTLYRSAREGEVRERLHRLDVTELAADEQLTDPTRATPSTRA